MNIFWKTILIFFSVVFLISLAYAEVSYKWNYFSEENYIENISGPIQSKHAYAAADNLRVRDMADIQSNILGKLKIGDIVTIISSSDNISNVNGISDYWYKMKSNNLEGYVFGYYLNDLEKNKILISNHNGSIIFRDDTGKILGVKRFVSSDQSFYSAMTKYKTTQNVPADFYLDFQSATSVKDSIITLLYLVGPIASEGWIIKYEIYNMQGNLIYAEPDYYPEIFYSEKHKYIFIINGTATDTEYNYGKLLKLINTDGKKIKSIETSPKFVATAHEDNESQNAFLLDKNEEYFFWSTPGQLLILDLNNLQYKIESYKFPKLGDTYYIEKHIITREADLVKLIFDFYSFPKNNIFRETFVKEIKL